MKIDRMLSCGYVIPGCACWRDTCRSRYGCTRWRGLHPKPVDPRSEEPKGCCPTSARSESSRNPEMLQISKIRKIEKGLKIYYFLGHLKLFLKSVFKVAKTKQDIYFLRCYCIIINHLESSLIFCWIENTFNFACL